MRRRTDGIKRGDFREIIVSTDLGCRIFWTSNPAEARAFAKNVRAISHEHTVRIRRTRDDQQINYIKLNFKQLVSRECAWGRRPKRHLKVNNGGAFLRFGR